MKKVSVVVPCYNAAQYLDQCMSHLLDQTIGAENIEIILVDDASTDNGETRKLIMQYEQQYPDTVIAVMLERNMRQGGARNAGISYAHGEYLLFCDADDWLLKEALEHCYHAAKEYDADVVEYLFKKVKDRDTAVELEKGTNDQLIELNCENERKKYLLHINHFISLGSQKKFYKTSFIQEHHIAFAEHLIFEEPSFVIPVRLYEKKHVFLDEKLYVYVMSPDSTMHGAWEKEHKWDNLQVWVHLMEDLMQRGLFHRYYEELEYLFLEWGFGLSLKTIFSKGCSLTREEWLMFIEITLKLFPGITQNDYIWHAEKSESYAVWERMLLDLLVMEITDENVQAANQAVEEAMKAAFGI